MQKLFQASNQPIEGPMQFAEGYSSKDLPKDLYGHVFFNSAVGTVNSGGLPYPKTLEVHGKEIPNPEWGSPVATGDGYLIRIDFDRAAEGMAACKTAVLTPPTYWADQATRLDGPLTRERKYRKFSFKNAGLSRFSRELGAANMLNTAVIPAKFAGDTHTRLLATYDAGRPFEFDPVSLKVITPIGYCHEWTQEVPSFLHYTFPIILTTAHPSFDPEAQHLYSVNYTKSIKTMIGGRKMAKAMEKYPHHVVKVMRQAVSDQKAVEEPHEKAKIAKDIFFDIDKHIQQHMDRGEKLRFGWEKFWKQVLNALTRFSKAFSVQDGVSLLRFDGTQLERWRLVDQEGNPLSINQTMHQTSLSKDYVVLMNSSFKFSLDDMFNFPFHGSGEFEEELDRLIRELTSIPMKPFTDTYLVKKSDLISGKDTAPAIKLKEPLDLECVHFSTDFDNPTDPSGDQYITLITTNNACNCASEWLRSYDLRKLPEPGSNGEIPDEWVGTFAIGDMAVDRMGKYVINATQGTIDWEKTIKRWYSGLQEQPDGNMEVGRGQASPAKNEEAKGVYNGQVHTWGMGFHTYRDIISADTPVGRIKHVFWQNVGLFPEALTDFIYGLYEDYAHRQVSTSQLLDLTRQGVPNVVVNCDTEDNMNIVDHFVLPKDHWVRSFQFVPRKAGSPEANPEPSLDGYLVCAVVVPAGDGMYRSEIWIMDAARLSQGPLCKMFHPELIFNYPFHSAWLPEIAAPKINYKVNIQQDFDQQIGKILFPWTRRKIRKFFQAYVYPHFA